MRKEKTFKNICNDMWSISLPFCFDVDAYLSAKKYRNKINLQHSGYVKYVK